MTTLRDRIANLKATVHPDSDVGEVCAHVELLEQALRYMYEQYSTVTIDGDGSFVSGVDGEVYEPPAHLLPVFTEVLGKTR